MKFKNWIIPQRKNKGFKFFQPNFKHFIVLFFLYKIQQDFEIY
jgi:hypothetical protein